MHRNSMQLKEYYEITEAAIDPYGIHARETKSKASNRISCPSNSSWRMKKHKYPLVKRPSKQTGVTRGYCQLKYADNAPARLISVTSIQFKWQLLTLSIHTITVNFINVSYHNVNYSMVFHSVHTRHLMLSVKYKFYHLSLFSNSNLAYVCSVGKLWTTP